MKRIFAAGVMASGASLLLAGFLCLALLSGCNPESRQAGTYSSPISSPMPATRQFVPAIYRGFSDWQPSLIILDRDGSERDWPWLWSVFGAVELREASSGPAVTIIQESPIDAPATLIVDVHNDTGQPVAGVVVVRSWTGCDIPLAPDYRRCGFETGVWGLTNEVEGRVGFGMGRGDWYDPEEGAGASTIWIAAPGQGTDCLSGLGMIAFTNHIHLDSAWRVADSAAVVRPNLGSKTITVQPDGGWKLEGDD